MKSHQPPHLIKTTLDEKWGRVRAGSLGGHRLESHIPEDIPRNRVQVIFEDHSSIRGLHSSVMAATVLRTRERPWHFHIPRSRVWWGGGGLVVFRVIQRRGYPRGTAIDPVHNFHTKLYTFFSPNNKTGGKRKGLIGGSAQGTRKKTLFSIQPPLGPCHKCQHMQRRMAHCLAENCWCWTEHVLLYSPRSWFSC